MADLGDLLAQAPDSVAVHHGERIVTVEALRDSSANLAEALERAHLPARRVVAVCLEDGSAAIAALFGVWRADAVHAPVSPRSTDAEIAAHLADLDAAVVVCAEADVDRMPEGIGVIVVDGVVAWEQRGAPRRDASPQPAGVALVQRTSGTTGRPKPVPLHHDAVLELMDGVISTLRGGGSPAQPAGERRPQPNLVPVSLSLWAGIYNVLFSMRVGAPVVLATPFDPKGFARLVARHEIRSTVLPPAAMVMLADAADRGEIEDLAPLRFVRSITAPLHVAQARRFHDRFGVTILNSYGQTELGGEVIGWSAADGRAYGTTKVGALGRPHDGVEVRIDGGEICIRTPTMNADDDGGLADRLTGDGFLRTGDLGHVDADGFIWIDGRLSDLIIRGGLKVFPAEVEEVLAERDGVAEVAVVGVPDERLGEVPVAVVVAVDPSRPPDPSRLESAVRDRLAAYKVPVRFVVIEGLPRNEVGKVLRRDLVTLLAST